MASNAEGLVVGGTMIPHVSPAFTLRSVIFLVSGMSPPLIFYDMVAIFCLIRLSREKGLKMVYS